MGLIQNSIREKQITNDLTALLVKAIRKDLDDKDRSDDLVDMPGFKDKKEYRTYMAQLWPIKFQSWADAITGGRDSALER